MACKHHLFAWVLAALLCVSCAATNPETNQAKRTVFPEFTVFLVQDTVPSSVIAALPSRMNHLRTDRRLTLADVVSQLGLWRYRRNVSANMRGGTYFMYLDRDHVLYLPMDVGTVPIDLPVFATP